MARKKRKQAGGNWCNKVRQTEKTLRNQSTITKLNNGKTHSILKILTELQTCYEKMGQPQYFMKWYIFKQNVQYLSDICDNIIHHHQQHAQRMKRLLNNCRRKLVNIAGSQSREKDENAMDKILRDLDTVKSKYIDVINAELYYIDNKSVFEDEFAPSIAQQVLPSFLCVWCNNTSHNINLNIDNMLSNENQDVPNIFKDYTEIFENVENLRKRRKL